MDYNGRWQITLQALWRQTLLAHHLKKLWSLVIYTLIQKVLIKMFYFSNLQQWNLYSRCLLLCWAISINESCLQQPIAGKICLCHCSLLNFSKIFVCVLLYVFCCGSFFNSGWLVSKSNCLDLNMATILAYARVNKCEIKYMQKYPDLILFRNQICGKSRNTSVFSSLLMHFWESYNLNIFYLNIKIHYKAPCSGVHLKDLLDL